MDEKMIKMALSNHEKLDWEMDEDSPYNRLEESNNNGDLLMEMELLTKNTFPSNHQEDDEIMYNALSSRQGEQNNFNIR